VAAFAKQSSQTTQDIVGLQYSRMILEGNSFMCTFSNVSRSRDETIPLATCGYNALHNYFNTCETPSPSNFI